jgi:hypothetical protein
VQREVDGRQFRLTEQVQQVEQVESPDTFSISSLDIASNGGRREGRAAFDVSLMQDCSMWR